MSQELNILVKRVQEGDKDAFGEIYKIFFPKIYRFIFFSVRDKDLAEDIAQSTFLRAWRARGSLSTARGSVQAYLFAIARNLTIDWQRRRKEMSIELISEPQDPKDFEEEIQRDEVKKTVWDAIHTLDDQEKHLVILRYFEELSYRDVARIVKKNEAAVRVRIHRILKMLKKKIKNIL